MPESSTIYNILIGVAIAGVLAYLFYSGRDKKPEENTNPGNRDSNGIRLQAYERLTLLVDRIAIPNLVSRTQHDGLTVREMQLVLTKNIRDEFDYNITQQIYITPEVWKAVKDLKENNLLLINQVANALPGNASGLELCRSLLQFTMSDSKGNLHELVSEALSFEAKKLL